MIRTSIIILIILAISCNNNSNLNEKKQENSIDSTSVNIHNTVSTIEAEILRDVLPKYLEDYQLAPFSKFSSKEVDRTIHTAKHQFFNEEKQKSVVIDVTDYGSIEYVPFAHIYLEPPYEVNMEIDTLQSRYYNGYSIWSPVDKTGRINVLCSERFVLKIRTTENDTINNFLKSILNKVDFEKLSKMK